MPPVYRTCPRCRDAFPATSEFFYQRPSDGRLEYCNTNANDCHGEYWRSRRRARPAARQRVVAEHRLDQSERVVASIIGPADRQFGVEIEAGFPPETVRSTTGIRTVSNRFAEEGLDDWVVSGEHCGLEMRTPPLVEFDQVFTACRLIHDLDLRVTGDCGLHVHLDASDLTLDRLKLLVSAWSRHETQIRRMIWGPRRTSSWCQPVSDVTVRDVARLPSDNQFAVSRQGPFMRGQYSDGHRYFSLNLACYTRLGTLECRLHQGSHNPLKIRSWVEFLRGFWAASFAGGLEETYSTTEELIDVVQAYYPRVDTTFLKYRLAELNPTRPGVMARA